MSGQGPNPRAVALCEACQQTQAAHTVRDDDPDQPYLLCDACRDRLLRRALRPLHWFNLAARHGWRKYLLHSDFYGDDGVARAPVDAPPPVDARPAPDLLDCASSLPRLVDYCMTRWSLVPADYQALRAFPPHDVLGEAAGRTTTGNAHVTEVAYDLCANVIGGPAASWVRDQYTTACERNLLFAWAQAAARCLPPPEGVEKTIAALRPFTGPALRQRKSALSWFRAPVVLDWIEQHVPRTGVTADWGQLAALSDLSFDRVDTWLTKGRPFSLVALDALATCIPSPGQAPLVKRLQPGLQDRPDDATLCHRLERHMADDPALRVQRVAQRIIENVDALRPTEAP